VAADLVVEQIDPYPGLGLVHQPSLEGAAELVVADDVELHQHVGLGGLDGREDGRKGGLPVLQQLQGVAPGEGQLGQPLQHREQARHPGRVGIGKGLIGVELRSQSIHHPVAGPAGRDVALEAVAAENPVQGHRHVGERDHGHDPGNGALGRAGGEQRPQT